MKPLRVVGGGKTPAGKWERRALANEAAARVLRKVVKEWDHGSWETLEPVIRDAKRLLRRGRQ